MRNLPAFLPHKPRVFPPRAWPQNPTRFFAPDGSIFAPARGKGLRRNGARQEIHKRWPAGVAGNCVPVFWREPGADKTSGASSDTNPGCSLRVRTVEIGDRRGSFERARLSPPAPNYAASPTPCAHRVGKGAIYAGNELARSHIRAMIEGEPIP